MFIKYFPRIVPIMRYVMWARQASDDNIIRRMRTACQITEARINTRPLRLLINNYFFTATTFRRMHLSIKTYFVGCLVIYGVQP